MPTNGGRQDPGASKAPLRSSLHYVPDDVVEIIECVAVDERPRIEIAPISGLPQ